MGQARVDALRPLESVAELRKELAAVAECVDLRKRGAAWTFSELGDPGEKLALLQVEGATLEPQRDSRNQIVVRSGNVCARVNSRGARRFAGAVESGRKSAG